MCHSHIHFAFLSRPRNFPIPHNKILFWLTNWWFIGTMWWIAEWVTDLFTIRQIDQLIKCLNNSYCRIWMEDFNTSRPIEPCTRYAIECERIINDLTRIAQRSYVVCHTLDFNDSHNDSRPCHENSWIIHSWSCCDMEASYIFFHLWSIIYYVPSSFSRPFPL